MEYPFSKQLLNDSRKKITQDIHIRLIFKNDSAISYQKTRSRGNKKK